MTATQLITALGNRGIEISRKTLFTYRTADPGNAPAEFAAVDDWARFILERQVYEPGRTQSPEAKERKAMSRSGRRRVKRNQANGDSDAEKFSLAEERRQRIYKLRLGNEARRSKLEALRQSTVAVAECEATLKRIKKVVSAELLRVPETLSRDLEKKGPQHIQQLLDGALRSALERLNRPENYFCSNL